MSRRALGWLGVLMACGAVETGAPSSVTQSRGAIVGGTVTTGDPNVFFLEIQANTGQGSLCTATLIDSKTLVTAAHCVDPRILGATSVNIYASNAPTEAQRQPVNTYHVVETRTHPTWDPNQLTGDIAMALLDRAPSGVAPKPWNTASLNGLGGAPLRAIGYGTTGNNAGSGIKRTVDLTIRQLTNTKILLGDQVSRGVCHGDSGGPSFHTFGDGIERIIGVHSYTTDEMCLDGADSRVDAFQSFIQQWLTEKEAPTCSRDGRCVAGCTPVDLDCVCKVDGQCTAACPDLSLDPDCPADCAANGICATAVCPVKDVDCVDEGQSCTSVNQCLYRKCVGDPQHLQTYCSRPCTDSSQCPDGMDCDVSNGSVCRRTQLPFVALGKACTDGQTWCGAGNVCNGRTGDETLCARACNVSTDCADPQTCEVGANGQRFCADPPKPLVYLLVARSEGGPLSGCASLHGFSFVALVLVLLRLRSAGR